MRLELLNTKKVYEIFPKPTDLYLLKRSLDKLRDELTQEEFPSEKFYSILLQLNLNPYSHNVKVLNEAMELCYYNDYLLDNLTIIHRTLAYRKGCSPEKIKSCLRGTTKNLNRNNSPQTLNRFFYMDDTKRNPEVSTKHFMNGLLIALKK